MVHLIVGYGEVGKALHKVLGEKVLWTDSKQGGTYSGWEKVDVIHICFPYGKSFEYDVRHWRLTCSRIIVHSTTPVGTCDKLEVTHSPIRGVHPNLAEGIKTFVKVFGGKKAEKDAKIFRRLGIRVRVYPRARVTESIKLWDTTQYGRLIMLEKEIYEWCEKNDVPFKAVYKQANIDYNEGYLRLGKPNVVRPYLNHVPGPIGGHCVLPNAKLLGKKL